MSLLLSVPDPIELRVSVEVHHADWRDLAIVLPRREDGTACDLLCVDAPYSERTHVGHDAGIASKDWRRSNGKTDRPCNRRKIDYASWTPHDVSAFVETWSPLTRGWFVSITDDVLAPAWASALLAAGRYVFAPLPFVSPGSRVRLTGDGPSAWTCWIVVARPSRAPFNKWGTLPGYYQCPPEDMPVVGGKPVALLRALVRDYSRPGDVVADPCCGAGTTGLAAKLEGRAFVGGDVDAAHADLAAERLRDLPTRAQGGTLALFGEVG